MPAAAFARRLGMSHAGVRKLETAEASDAITLASLRKLVAAMGGSDRNFVESIYGFALHKLISGVWRLHKATAEAYTSFVGMSPSRSTSIWPTRDWRRRTTGASSVCRRSG